MRPGRYASAESGDPRRFAIVVSLLLLATPARAYTYFSDLASWQAAVGSHAVEDFESFPEMRLPIDGGITDLGRFVIENDDQGDNEWSGVSGIWQGSNWYAYPEIPDTKNLIVSTERTGFQPGPTYINAIFPQPIYAYVIEYSWCEDFEYWNCAFEGFVLDSPTDLINLTQPHGCNHSWCAIEAIRWATVPEPATGLLVTASLLGLAGWRRVRA